MVRVVADQHRDVDRELALAPAVQQVVDAVRLAGGQQPDPGPVVGEAELPPHGEPLGHRGEGGTDLVSGQVEAGELDLDPQEEGDVAVVGVLLQVDDVAAVPGHEGRDGRDDAGPVRAGDEQAGRGRGRHDVSLSPDAARTTPWAIPVASASPPTCTRRSRA